MAEIELKTAPADFRFPTTNQTRHCFTRYIEFHSGRGSLCLTKLDMMLTYFRHLIIHSIYRLPRCLTAKGEESGECEKFAKYYRSLCPGEWVDKWNEQRENGTFPGPL